MESDCPLVATHDVPFAWVAQVFCTERAKFLPSQISGFKATFKEISVYDLDSAQAHGNVMDTCQHTKPVSTEAINEQRLLVPACLVLLRHRSCIRALRFIVPNVAMVSVLQWLFKGIRHVQALLANGHEDAFQENTQENNLPEGGHSSDDILDINQPLIPLEAPESSFLTEGDIIKASPFRLFSSANPRWPKKGGIVQIPYVISHKYDKSSVKMIQEAFEDFAEFTCIKFIPYSYQRDFISIVPLSGCFSNVGRIGGMQVVSLAPACLRKGKGVALHEFMHVLGFWHEHSRADRDKYVSISWNEILTGFEINFMKSWNPNMLADYDYSSVMHYGRNAFSMTGLPTIIPLSSSHAILGQRWNLSSLDIVRVNKLYKCSQVALQPETSTERILQEKIKDFIPHEPEPCSSPSQIKLSTAQSLGSITEAAQMAHSARETLQKPDNQTKVGITQLLNNPTGKGSDAVQTQTPQIMEIPLAATLTQEGHGQTLLSSAVATKMEDLTVAQEVPPETQPAETEIQTVVKVAQDSTFWRALENPTSSAKALKTQASDFEKAYTPSQQKTTEAMTRTASQMKHTIFFATRTVQGTLYGPLSGTRATYAENETKTSILKEMRGQPAIGSSESEDVSGPVQSTEGYPFTLNGKQSEELVQQSISSSGNELGNFTDVLLREGTQAKASASPGVPENPTEASQASGVEVTISREAGSQALFTTDISHRMTEEETKSSYKTKGSRPVHTQPSSTRGSSPANDFEQLHSTEEALAFGNSEVQDHHTGQIGATAVATSPWALVTHRFAAPGMKEAIPSQSSSVVPSVEVEWSSLPRGSLTRKGRWEETVTPSGSLFENGWVQATEMPMKSEKLTPLHAELAGQAPTKINSYSFAEPASLTVENNQAMFSAERGPLQEVAWSQNPGKPDQREGLILQASKTEKYGLSAPSTGVQTEGPQVKQTTETAFASATENVSIEQKITVSHGKETGSKILVGTEEIEAHRRESMQGALTSKSVKSPVPSYTQVGQAETLHPLTDFSLVNNITGAQNGDTQARLRRATSARQETTASSSGAKFSYVELTTKGLSLLERQFKLRSSSQPNPGTEVEEHGTILEGTLLPMHEKTKTALSWVMGSRNPPKSIGFGNFVELLKDTTSSAVSEQEHTMPYKRTIPEITVSGKVSNISSNFFTTLVLGNQTSKYTKEPTNSPLLWETQSIGSSERSLPQILSKLSSNPREMSYFIDKEHANLSSTTEQMFLGVKRTTANGQKDIAQRTIVPSSLVDMQPTAIPHAATGEMAVPLTTSLLKSITYRGEPATISPIKESLPATVGITTAPMTFSANAIPVQTREIQASIPFETGDLTSTSTKKSGEAGLEAYASSEIDRMLSARASTLGLHEGPTTNTAQTKVIGIPQLSLEPETAWPTYKTAEERQTNPLLEKASKSGIYVLGEKTTVVNLGLGSETASKNGGGTIAITTSSVKLASQSGYTHSSPPLVEEPTIFHEKEKAMNISVGPTRKLILEMLGSPILGNERITSPDSQNNLNSKKTMITLHLEISSEGMYLTDMESTEGVTATTVASLVHPQTANSDEIRIQFKYHQPHISQGLERENGNSGLLPVKGTPTVIDELPGPSAETLRQISETHTAIRQEGMNQMRKVEPEHQEKLFVDSPTSGHQLVLHCLADSHKLAPTMPL
uniref:Uncharacterized protein n=1 Tax=Sphaerodactylus townsendi TaxID=933632 RepID=A0ACB8EYP9_9SAUR